LTSSSAVKGPGTPKVPGSLTCNLGYER
jgi:hypothetical protein